MTFFDASFFSDAAWDVLASFHGEVSTVTVTPAGGSPTTVKAIFQRGRFLDPAGSSDARKPEAFGVLLVRTGAVANWIPAEGDAVLIGSETFAVDSFGERTAPILEIQIIRTDA